MRPPINYRQFDYDRRLLPNEYLASLEEGVTDIEGATGKTGFTLGYPGWGALYYLLICHLDPNKFNLIVETGANLGCSTIILAQALADTKRQGQVHTFEIDSARAKNAVDNIAKAGLSSFVSVHCGNSLLELPHVLQKNRHAIRFAFLDGSHAMNDVLQEFTIVHDKLDPDGLVVFDNTYAIAEPPEDPRVNGALMHILKTYRGNLVNLPFVSWCTPGLAVWQTHPFPIVETPTFSLSCHGMPADETIEAQIACAWTHAVEKALHIFPDLTINDIIAAVEHSRDIRHKIQGRAPGDLGDKIAQYAAPLQCARERPEQKTLKCLEIGSLFGGSCLQMLGALRHESRNGHATCIDPFDGYYGSQNDQSAVPVTTETLLRNCLAFGFTEPAQVELRVAKSQDLLATQGLTKRAFETVLIDGDHSYEGVRADWSIYQPYVAEGGYLLFDDYGDPAWPELTRAVDEICRDLPPEWTVAGALGTTLILRHAKGVVRPPCPETSPQTDQIRYLKILLHLEITETRLADTLDTLQSERKTISNCRTMIAARNDRIARLKGLTARQSTMISNRDKSIAELKQTVADISSIVTSYLRIRWKHLAANEGIKEAFLFGAGKHTPWLLNIVREVAGPIIIAILDDRAASGMLISGIPVLKPEEMQIKDGDAVIFSTDVYQTRFYKRCREMWGDKVELINLYDRCPAGPYPKTETGSAES